MAIYIKVNGAEYPAEPNYSGIDREWGGRETKTIRLHMTGAEAAALLPDNTTWTIVQRETVDVLDENGMLTGQTEERIEEWDNSEYCKSGAITDHRDGTVSIKMGKATEAETLRAQLEDAEHAAKILLMEEK